MNREKVSVASQTQMPAKCQVLFIGEKKSRERNASGSDWLILRKETHSLPFVTFVTYTNPKRLYLNVIKRKHPENSKSKYKFFFSTMAFLPSHIINLN